MSPGLPRFSTACRRITSMMSSGRTMSFVDLPGAAGRRIGARAPAPIDPRIADPEAEGHGNREWSEQQRHDAEQHCHGSATARKKPEDDPKPTKRVERPEKHDQVE